MNLKELYQECSSKALDRVAERVNVGRATLRAWALGYKGPNGKVRKPSMEQIYALEKAHVFLKAKDMIEEFYPRED